MTHLMASMKCTSAQKTFYYSKPIFMSKAYTRRKEEKKRAGPQGIELTAEKTSELEEREKEK